MPAACRRFPNVARVGRSERSNVDEVATLSPERQPVVLLPRPCREVPPARHLAWGEGPREVRTNGLT